MIGENALVSPERLFCAEEVVKPSTTIPSTAGIYGWYFDDALSLVPREGAVAHDGWSMLYVGISPRRPSKDGRMSKQTIRKRIQNHFAGNNASRSTLRLSLGVLLADELQLVLKPSGGNGRLSFGIDGERVLSQWMASHARVVWQTHPAPWDLEDELIETLDLPLNLDGNRSNAFHPVLSALRASAKAAGRAA